MLDLMRQANRRKWFVWTIILFVVLSFVLAIFAIWGGAATGGSTLAGGGWVARINKEEISERDFLRVRSQIESRYRQQLGNMFDQFAPQMDLDRQAIGHLVSQSLAYAEAVRQGLQATEKEVAEAIVNAPVFHRDGRFIGREAYEYELRARGYDVAEYERGVARDLTAEKLRNISDTFVGVGEAELEEAFEREGRTAEVDYVLLMTSDFAGSAEPSAREIEDYYRGHREDYKTPERRRAAAVMIARDEAMAALDVPDSEVEEYYEVNRETLYTVPEQRRASHILFKIPEGTAPEAEGAVRQDASEVLSAVRAGADFAEMARQHSEDTTASAGGDLGWFGRGRMVPEFEQVAFSLAEGQVSDLVGSPFGYHIIKLTGSRAAGARPIEEVREPIRQQLRLQKAQQEVQSKADAFAARLAQQISSFEATAAEMGYTVQDTGFAGRAEPLGPLGTTPQVSAEIFRLRPGERSGALPSPQGVVFVELKEIQAPEPATFESVRDRVKTDLVGARALERARAAAADVAGAGPAGFKAAADRRKLEVKSTGTFTRATAPSEFGDAVKEAVFSHRPNEVVGPLETTGGVAVVKIVKRGPESPEETAGTKARLRLQILDRKRDEAFTALLRRLQQSAAIEDNPEFFAALARRRPS